MAFALSRNERVYLAKETVFGQAAALSGTDACRHIRCTLTPEVQMLVRPDKTGSRTATPGISGRRSGRWSLEMSLAASGTPGVVPDCDPLLVALFGAEATVVPDTSVTYTLSDAIKTFTLGRYRTPASVMQQLAVGCVVNEATFQLGQDVATWSASGACKWIIDSVTFASLDAEGKSGLSAFPAEPSNPQTSGGIIAGFTGQATFDGNVLANIRTATLRIQTGNDIVRDTFGKFYGDSTEGDLRAVSLQFSLYDQDDAGTTNLYQKALSKTPIDVILQIGTAAGSKWTFTLAGVQLAFPDLDDGQRRWAANFGDSPASGTSISSLDEITLTIS
jgi:hypothetical protein